MTEKEHEYQSELLRLRDEWVLCTRNNGNTLLVNYGLGKKGELEVSIVNSSS